jgi:flagellar biosynthetic protein FliQ
MGQGDAITIIQEGLYTILLVSAPMLAVGLIVGVIVSIFQAATQINEQTLGFIPKIVAIFASIIIFGPWMLNKLIDFTNRLYQYMGTVIR